MKTKLFIVLLILGMFILFGCEEETTKPDTTPPTVQITSPMNNSTISGIVDININASDNKGIARVEIYIDGVLSGETTSAPWGFTWDTTLEENDDYTLQAKAYDTSANVGISNLVNVTVENSIYLFYDDDSFEQSWTIGDYNGQLWTRFTMPTGWNACQITKVELWMDDISYDNFDIVYQDDYDYSGGFIFPYSSYYWGTLKSDLTQPFGWYTHTITSNSFSSLHFFVGIEPLSPDGPYLGGDTDSFCYERSGYCYDGWNTLWTDMDLAIRIYVVPVSSKEGSKEVKPDSSEGRWLTAENMGLEKPDKSRFKITEFTK